MVLVLTRAIGVPVYASRSWHSTVTTPEPDSRSDADRLKLGFWASATLTPVPSEGSRLVTGGAVSVQPAIQHTKGAHSRQEGVIFQTQRAPRQQEERYKKVKGPVA